MNKKVYVLVCVIMIAIVGYFGYASFARNEALKKTPLESPLFLKGDLSSLSAEQRERIASYRKHLLLRVKSGEVLATSEKLTLAQNISTEKVDLGELTLINQNFYKFNEEELWLIKGALEK